MSKKIIVQEDVIINGNILLEKGDVIKVLEKNLKESSKIEVPYNTNKFKKGNFVNYKVIEQGSSIYRFKIYFNNEKDFEIITCDNIKDARDSGWDV